MRNCQMKQRVIMSHNAHDHDDLVWKQLTTNNGKQIKYKSNDVSNGVWPFLTSILLHTRCVQFSNWNMQKNDILVSDFQFTCAWKAPLKTHGCLLLNLHEAHWNWRRRTICQEVIISTVFNLKHAKEMHIDQDETTWRSI